MKYQLTGPPSKGESGAVENVICLIPVPKKNSKRFHDRFRSIPRAIPTHCKQGPPKMPTRPIP